jgi:hypothetical protein
MPETSTSLVKRDYHHRGGAGAALSVGLSFMGPLGFGAHRPRGSRVTASQRHVVGTLPLGLIVNYGHDIAKLGEQVWNTCTANDWVNNKIDDLGHDVSKVLSWL